MRVCVSMIVCLGNPSLCILAVCVCACDARTLSSYILVKRPGDSEQPILLCRGALCLCVRACVGVAFV